MSDLNAKVVADLKRELAEAKAELAQERERANSGDWVEKAHAETLDAACKELESKLEAARAEIEQQRTRAEAAEQELREVKQREEEGIRLFDQIVAELRAKVATAAPVTIYAGKLQDKLERVRAHLAGVDVAELSRKNKSATGGTWTDEKPGRDEDGWPMASIVAATPGRQQIYSDVEGGTYPHADCKLLVALRNAAGALLAAAREALEP